MTPTPSSSGGVPMHVFLQIAIGVGIQVAIFFLVDGFWAICSAPLMFALFGAVNLHDIDANTELRLKRILTWVTIGALTAAYLYRMYVR